MTPTRGTSAFSRPSWSRQRADDEVDELRRRSRRRGRSPARGRARRARAADVSMFSRWIADSGVSRGMSTSRRSSLSATDAARWIRFASRPTRSSQRSPSSRGRSTYPSTFAEPDRVRRAASRSGRRPSRRRPPRSRSARAPRRAAARVAVELGREHLDPGARGADPDLAAGRRRAPQQPRRVRRAGCAR